MIKKLLRNNLLLICLLGLLTRAFFTLFLGGLYFGRENIYVDGDTAAWLNSFINLIETGSYTAVPAHEYGYFLRMPGYSFFIGIFYLITGGNLDITYPLIGWIQILLDILAIWLVYKIALKLFRSEKNALFSAALYAFYPFIIVWNPVVYSESVSILLMLAGIYFLLYEKKYHWFYAGLFLGLGILFRPQVALLVPIAGIFILWFYNWKIKSFYKPVLQFALAVVIFYGCWPISNILIHKKVVLTQDLRGAPNWNEDVIAFMQFTYSVKTEWEPQFSNILHNKEVTWPENAYFSKEDSAKLERAVYLAKNCGSGFSYWQGYWQKPFQNDSCTHEIATLFNELRDNQIKNFPWNYYLYLPLQNLKKAAFKNELYNTEGVRKYASCCFIIALF